MTGGKTTSRPVQVGGVTIHGAVGLAPLAGYTEYPWRVLVAKFGCPFAITPLISAEALGRNRDETYALLRTGPDDADVVAGQLFGARPDAMAAAAAVVAARFPIVDINCGCAVPKVLKQNAGAALLEDLGRLGDVARAVVKASRVPVTAKMRVGMKTPDKGVSAARVLYDQGIQGLAVHGRTAAQGFAGELNVAAIRDIVNAVPIPVWANGDVGTCHDARKLLNETGAAGVLVGRAAVAAPWLPAQIQTFLESGEDGTPPSADAFAAMVKGAYQKAAQQEGDERAAIKSRKHLLLFLKTYRAPKRLRLAAAAVRNARDVDAVLADLAALAVYV